MEVFTNDSSNSTFCSRLYELGVRNSPAGSCYSFFTGTSYAGKNAWHENALSLPVSKGLQGFCAILIILHHISQILAKDAGILGILENAGVCFVGIFFFFSGYGLLKSLDRKPDYLTHFFRNRLPVILVPFYMILLIFSVFYSILGERFLPVDWIYFLTGIKLLNHHAWYIVEIFFLYLIFYFVFRFIKKRRSALLIISLLVAVLTIFSLLLGHGEFLFQGEWWFNTTFLFVIGLFIAQYEVAISAFVRKFYAAILTIGTILLIVLHYATSYMLTNYSYWSETEYRMAYGDKFKCLAVQLPFVIIFVLWILTITMKLQFKNRILDFLGSISLELYLIHNLFLELFLILGISNGLVYSLSVLVWSIVAAILLHIADQRLIGLIKK